MGLSERLRLSHATNRIATADRPKDDSPRFNRPPATTESIRPVVSGRPAVCASWVSSAVPSVDGVVTAAWALVGGGPVSGHEATGVQARSHPWDAGDASGTAPVTDAAQARRSAAYICSAPHFLI